MKNKQVHTPRKGRNIVNCRRPGALTSRATIIALVCLMMGAMVGVSPLPPASAEADSGSYSHSGLTSDACTVGVANGYVTVDSRPILWKVRDLRSDERQQLFYASGSAYDYIGVRSEGGSICMGLNEVGVATGNSLVRLTPGAASNYSFQRHILENCGSLDEIEGYIDSEVDAGTCNASGCFPFIDADGNAVMFEVNRSDRFWEYDSMDPDRQEQGLGGFVVRANEFHQMLNGTDDVTIGGRYESGRYNVSGLMGIDDLSTRSIIEGNDYASGFEFVRYGPGRPLSAISKEGPDGSQTRSAIVVHGVAPGEAPELATMWVILGQTNYSIAVPAWVKVSDIPQCLGSGDMYDSAASLCNKGNEEITQAATFPVEAHVLEIVTNTLLPHWRTEGAPSTAEMKRIQHHMAEDAYSLLYCLDNSDEDNKAPDVDFSASTDGLTVGFTLLANDSDGSITDIQWNFGDDQKSAEESPLHTYDEPGTYLVSCTVIDDDVGITDWMYCSVSAESITLLGPDNGALGWPVSPVSFRWPRLRGTKWRFALAKDAAMTDVVAEADVMTNGYEYEGTLDYSTNYFWRVMAIEPAPSDWSATFSFQTEAAPPPLPPGDSTSPPCYGVQLLSPGNGSIGCPVSPASFSWSPSKQTTKYKVVLARDAALTNVVAQTEVGATAYEYEGTLDYSTNYFWRVMAIEPAPSDWSATFCFQTEAAPPPLPPAFGFSCTEANTNVPAVSLDLSPFLLGAMLLTLAFTRRGTPPK